MSDISRCVVCGQIMYRPAYRADIMYCNNEACTQYDVDVPRSADVEQCSTCKFHKAPVRGNTQGQCRRWPPLAHYRILVNTEPTRYEHSIDQPYVDDDGWCGEYQRAK